MVDAKRPGNGSDVCAEPARIVAVVTCKDRLEHLRLTLPELARVCPVVVVCYDDPAAASFVHKAAQGAGLGDVHVLSAARDPKGPPFWKCRALNIGASYAIQLVRAERLLFVDADTFVDQPLALAAELNALELNDFACAGREHGVDRPGLTGVLCCTKEAFLLSRGFDLTYRGWGMEDVDMRLELAMLGARVRWLSPGLLQPIKHGDELRTKHRAPGQTPERSWSITRAAFLEKWRHRLQLPELRNLKELPPELKVLCFHNATIGGVFA